MASLKIYSKEQTDGLLQGKADASALATKQDALVSGTNIKTVNGISLLGSGDIEIQGGGGGAQTNSQIIREFIDKTRFITVYEGSLNYEGYLSMPSGDGSTVTQIKVVDYSGTVSTAIGTNTITYKGLSLQVTGSIKSLKPGSRFVLLSIRLTVRNLNGTEVESEGVNGVVYYEED